MKTGHVAVIDIGKTNAKLALVDLADLSEIAVITRPNTVRPGPPYPHFDTEGHWAFLLDGLRDFHAQHGVQAISITTHGACAALLDRDGALAAPILDYEHTGPDETAADYDAIRPPFAETGSPRLRLGLNIGAQLFWQFATDRGLAERTHQIVTYPQYWGHRLTGIGATDVTSLGCHSDLWNPHRRCFSSLVDALGIRDKIAPAKKSSDILGPVLPDIAARTGLAPDTPVFCGIHDSNASLLPHILANRQPFSVVSTGTWVVAMTVGGQDVTLDPEQDVLINVNALGDPVPSARFMGGREHDLATQGPYPEPDDAALAVVLAEQRMILPGFAPETGPFRGQKARWVGAVPAPGTALRGAEVALYLALVVARCLQNTGHRGSIIVEGPFAANPVFLRMLAVATQSTVVASKGQTGTSQGAAIVACQEARAAAEGDAFSLAEEPRLTEMRAYADAWTHAVGDPAF
ncbi:FGGY-family carbohydrate kinase [Antarctobacter sp.]|uniref:FGGY-family carbohydrate kinase n=1 Tax=Antarctobacter sp. TaxID=1872577 RepID=UPI003A91AED5